jgi:hypothetical protein
MNPDSLSTAMKTSDFVLVGSTLLLATTAIAAPVLTEWLKRRFWAPKLTLEFDLEKPDCCTTQFNVGGVPNVTVPAQPVHIFRLRVRNVGRSQAKRCEVVVEGIAKRNAARQLVWHDKYTPVPLKWGSGNGDYVEINNGRSFFCDFLNVLHPDHQAFFKKHGGFIAWPGSDESGLGVEVVVSRHFYSQPNWLPQGDYRLKVAVFSDNAPVQRAEFELAWSGKWAADEAGIFNECVPSLVE